MLVDFSNYAAVGNWILQDQQQKMVKELVRFGAANDESDSEIAYELIEDEEYALWRK